MPLVFKTVEVIDNQETGNAARAARINAKKTLAQVAKKMGISTMFLCDLELGRRNWTEENIKQFTKALK